MRFGPRLLQQFCVMLYFAAQQFAKIHHIEDALIFVASKTDTSFSSPAF